MKGEFKHYWFGLRQWMWQVDRYYTEAGKLWLLTIHAGPITVSYYAEKEEQ